MTALVAKLGTRACVGMFQTSGNEAVHCMDEPQCSGANFVCGVKHKEMIEAQPRYCLIGQSAQSLKKPR